MGISTSYDIQWYMNQTQADNLNPDVITSDSYEEECDVKWIKIEDVVKKVKELTNMDCTSDHFECIESEELLKELKQNE